MNKMILSLGFVFSFSAFASTHKYEVKNMHCKGCVESVEGEVCEPGKFKSCKVGLAKGKKNTGEIVIETNEGQTLALAEVSELVKKSGDQYVVTEVKSKK